MKTVNLASFASSVLLVLVVASEGRAAPAWQDGIVVNTGRSPSCNPLADFLPVQLGSAWVGENVDVAGREPKIGHTTYVRLVWNTVGNPCAGAVVRMTLALPPQVYVDVREGFPIHCRLGLIGHELTDHVGGGCPEDAEEEVAGRHDFGPFLVPSSSTFELLVPIASTAEGDGTAGSPAVTASFDFADGNIQGELVSSKRLVVFPNPTAIYLEPATGVTRHEAHVEAVVENHYRAGAAFFDIGETTAYEALTLGPVPVPAHVYGYRIFADFQNLRAGITYHWRVRFVDGDGVEAVSPDRVFTTGAPLWFSLTVEDADGGSVTLAPAQQQYEEGSVVTLTAHAAAQHRFERFLIDGRDAGASSSLQMMVVGAHRVRAVFSRIDAGNAPGSQDEDASDGPYGYTAPGGSAGGDDAPTDGGCSALAPLHFGPWAFLALTLALPRRRLVGL